MGKDQGGKKFDTKKGQKTTSENKTAEIIRRPSGFSGIGAIDRQYAGVEPMAESSNSGGETTDQELSQRRKKSLW